MKKKIVCVFFAILVMAVTFGNLVNPVVTQVFAAEQTDGQDKEVPPDGSTKEAPPADQPKNDANEHAGHHQM